VGRLGAVEGEGGVPNKEWQAWGLWQAFGDSQLSFTVGQWHASPDRISCREDVRAHSHLGCERRVTEVGAADGEVDEVKAPVERKVEALEEPGGRRALRRVEDAHDRELRSRREARTLRMRSDRSRHKGRVADTVVGGALAGEVDHLDHVARKRMVHIEARVKDRDAHPMARCTLPPPVRCVQRIRHVVAGHPPGPLLAVA